MSDTKPRASIKLPSDFVFGQLRPDHTKPTPPAPPTPLGPLSAFVGDWVGNGFNTIFRPDSAATPTPLPNPVPPPPPPRDNILELNLTSESLSFSPTLGSVPNRGTGAQPDAFLNGVPYLQTINDITIHGESVAIHFGTRYVDSRARDHDPAAGGNGHAHGLHSPRHNHRGSRTRCGRDAWATDDRRSGHHTIRNG
ncbi:MAG: hypothetical protein WAM98_09335 [Terriglobales bacterium]